MYKRAHILLVSCLLVACGNVGLAKFDLDSVACPDDLAPFYQLVRNGAADNDRPVYVRFLVTASAPRTWCAPSSCFVLCAFSNFVNDVGEDAVRGVSDYYRLRVQRPRAVRTWSLWRFWLRTIVKLAVERDDLSEHGALVRAAHVKFPIAKKITSMVLLKWPPPPPNPSVQHY
ncbi:unnamed protein product [Peniophora sp. CBMAI 1063]|nr:unnamed protein product [Peniophora sp. CBMAI 1063]